MLSSVYVEGKPDENPGTARVYTSDHTEVSYCLRQTRHCLLLYLTFHLLHLKHNKITRMSDV